MIQQPIQPRFKNPVSKRILESIPSAPFPHRFAVLERRMSVVHTLTSSASHDKVSFRTLLPQKNICRILKVKDFNDLGNLRLLEFGHSRALLPEGRAANSQPLRHFIYRNSMTCHLIAEQFLVHSLTPFTVVCRLRHLYYTHSPFICQGFLCLLRNIFFFSSFGVAFWKRP